MINSNDFMETLQISQQQILNTIAIWVSEGSGWTISSIVEHYINIVMYRPTMGSSYIPLPTELQHHNKSLINLLIMTMNVSDGVTSPILTQKITTLKELKDQINKWLIN